MDGFWKFLFALSSRKYRVLAGVFLVSAFFLYGLRYINFDNSVDKMVNKKSGERAAYKNNEYTFDTSNMVAIVIDASRAGGVFAPETLKMMTALRKELEKVDERLIANEVSRFYKGEWTSQVVGYLRLKASELADSPMENEAFADKLYASLTDESALYDSISEDTPGFTKEDAHAIASSVESNNKTAKRSLVVFSTPIDEGRRMRMGYIRKVSDVTTLGYPTIKLADAEPVLKDLAKWGLSREKALDLVDAVSISGPTSFEGFAVSSLSDLGFSAEEISKVTSSPERFNQFLVTLKNQEKIISVQDLIPANTEITPLQANWARFKMSHWKLFDGSFYDAPKERSIIRVIPWPMITSKNIYKAFEEIDKIVGNFSKQYPSYTFEKVGEPFIAWWFGKLMRLDIVKLIPLALLILIVILWLSFRSVYGVIFPLIPVGLSIVWTMGLMAWMGTSINILTNTIPVLLIAIGAAYGIHFFNGFNNNREILKTFRLEGRGILLAGLTTIAGFGSLALSDIESIYDFGVFTSAGVFFALVVTYMVLPAVAKLLKYEPPVADLYTRKVSNTMRIFAMWVTSWRYAVIGIILVGVAMAGFGLNKIESYTSAVEMFKKDNPVYGIHQRFNRNFNGSNIMTLTFQSSTGAPIALDTNVLKMLDEITEEIGAEFPLVGKTLSINGLLKRMNQTMNYGDVSYDRLPDIADDPDEESRRGLIASYIDKYAKDTTATFATPDRTGLRVIVQMKTDRPGHYDAITAAVGNKLKTKYSELVQKNGLTFLPSGIVGQYKSVNNAIVTGQVESTLCSILTVFFIVWLLLGSALLALFSCVPLILVIISNFGFMGHFGVPLEVATSIIACVAVGIGIDYGLHFLTRYRFLRRSESSEDAIETTFSITGKGIMINAFSVALGFAVLAFSGFVPLIRFGLFVSLTMLLTGFFSLTFLPALILLFHSKKVKTEDTASEVL